MKKAGRLLDRMQRNPAGDWTIADIEQVCRETGWRCLPPTGGGSHWKIAKAGQPFILTVPARRPIKPVYIRRLVTMLENDDGTGDAAD